MERILKAQHWQVFLVIVGVPLLYWLILNTFVSDQSAIVTSSSVRYFDVLEIIPQLILLIVFMNWGWYWAVGIKLQKHIPSEVRLRTRFFKFCIIFQFIYTISFCIYLNWYNTSPGSSQPEIIDSYWVNYTYLLIAIIHMFLLFCSFYFMYFTARTIKTAELKRRVWSNDLIGEFFLIMFFPIGVWILQPRINKIITEDMNNLNQPISDLKI